MNFTDQIAHYILENKLDTSHLMIVLPSERAKKYISASLFEANGKAMIAPEMITIDRWIKGLSTFTIIDKTRALVELYRSQENPEMTETSFDEFLSWGTILLSDFDEIDRYLLDSKEVFKNLADIKELESWNIEERELSANQKKFMEFWDKLPALYVALNKRLDAKKVCYAGAAYHEISTSIDLVFKEDPKRIFLFAGFNALSKAEISIMKQLHTMGRGHILINADSFYLNDLNHEAGHFLRQLKRELNVTKLPFVEDRLLHTAKSIEVVECAQTTGQVKVAASKLMELSKEEIDKTLILLADESLITPLLKNLPRVIEKANITLGMPLRASSLRNWVDILFGIQERKQRFKTEAVYYTDIQRLLNHPFIVACSSPEEIRNAQLLEQNIVRYNRIFIKVDSIEIGETIDVILQLLATNWENDWVKAMKIIREMSQRLFKVLTQNHQFEKALLEGFDKALVDFQNIISEGLPMMNLRSFKGLFNQHWGMKSIAYHGNPIEGLQIMGLLETRLLDFKRIICLGLNEGSMPPTNPIQTMIPMDLRRYLGLPTPREKQGLFAHHFYRLLHHCDELLVTYTSAGEAISSNEQSRYLLQLELELTRMNPAISFQRKFYTIPMNEDGEMTAVSIAKTPEITKRLDEIFAKSTSVSMLNKFLKCPLDFYYQYVLEFGEEDSVEEEIESSTFGTFIHETLEDLFRPFAQYGKDGLKKATKMPNVTVRDIDTMLGRFELILRAKFSEHFGNDAEAFATGKNLLSFQMALELTKNFLNEQKKMLENQHSLFIQSIEELLEYDLEVSVFGEMKKVHLKGFVDRIDCVDGKVRIIDYKSGVTKEENVTLTYRPSSGISFDFGDEEKSELLKKMNGSKYTLQLLTYCFLYKMKYHVLPDEVGIYSFVKIKSGLFGLNLINCDLAAYVELFPQIISAILEEMYSEEKPFEHKEVDEFHNYCSYCS